MRKSGVDFGVPRTARGVALWEGGRFPGHSATGQSSYGDRVLVSRRIRGPPDSAEAIDSHRSPPRQMSHVSVADAALFQNSGSEKPNLITAFTKRTARGQFGHSGSQFTRNFGGVHLTSKQ